MESSTSTREITRTVGTETGDAPLGSDMRVQQLIPGIPDEITLEQICTKLPWRVVKILSSVSRTWQKAIEARQVYNARVRAGSTETLVVHSHGPRSRLALYSRIDQCCYELPPSPPEMRRQGYERIGLDGKIYVLGGLEWGTTYAVADVYVLDVAGGREWKQCASMQEPKVGFGCGIFAGKIYVFGGKSDRFLQMPVRGSEVYDPGVDAWSPIARMPSLRVGHLVAAIGDELFVFKGEVFNPDLYEFDTNARVDGERLDVWDDREHCLIQPSSLDVYHPAKNEWRVVDRVEMHAGDTVFMANGELHLMSNRGIAFYDMDKESWINHHRQSFPQGDQSSCLYLPHSASAVDDDVFAVSYTENLESDGTLIFSESLVQIGGFNRGREEVVWHKTSCRSARSVFRSLTCPIKL